MGFTWAITGVNELRPTWRPDTTVYSASSEAVGYPKENAADGNVESEWRATASPGNVIFDTGDASPDYEYIALRSSYDNIPTAVSIATCDTAGGSYVAIPNDYDLSVNTTLTSAASPTSRILSVAATTDMAVGNTIRLNDGVQTARNYLIIAIGANYLEIDRYPEAYNNGATVTVTPDACILAAVAAGSRKRYVKVTVTATTPHILEAQAFAVSYTFDNSALPLNPFPVNEIRSAGNVYRSMSGYGIGKMHTGPNFSRWALSIGRLGRDARAIIAWLERQERFGMLMDNGEWFELQLQGNITMSRRHASEVELIAYSAQLTVEEV